MTSVVLIQARTNSSRLPAKVLLPIGGLPVVALAAMRAGNTGRKVIVVTSDKTSDNYLAEVVRTHGINCFRGSLENTLSRFVRALDGYDDETIVFRLTADNVIPDGSLLDEIEQDFLHRGLEYIVCNGANSGLPYGMSAEATRLKHLRKSLISNLSDYDLEHVTPAIIRKLGVQYFEKYVGMKMGQYRCTIDCLDDYLEVISLFEGVKDPVKENAFSLIEGLKGRQLQPSTNRPASRLVLGTAQLGMPYGIMNKTGQPSKQVAAALIKTAIVNGVDFIDTARAYGDSEAAIRHAMSNGWHGRARIVSKLDPLIHIPAQVDKTICHSFVDASLFKSLNTLGVQQIDTLLLHRAEHLESCDGQFWSRLLMHQQQGRIKKLGVSVQNPDELLKVLAVPEVEHIQLPMNILDWRWQIVSKKVSAIRAQRKLIVHVRSVYLQGLLIGNDPNQWALANVDNPAEIQTWLSDATHSFKRESIKDLCLAYINGLDWIDGIVIGMETLEQLNENLKLITKPPLDQSQLVEVNNTRPALNESSLNPAMWKTRTP